MRNGTNYTITPILLKAQSQWELGMAIHHVYSLPVSHNSLKSKSYLYITELKNAYWGAWVAQLVKRLPSQLRS